MLRRILVLALLTAGFALADGPVYELRTYTTLPGKLEALKARFRDDTIRIFNKHGIQSIGYWVPQDGEKSKNTLVYMVKHPSRAEGEQHWKDFAADPEWVKAAADSEKGGKIVDKIESVWLDPTTFSALK